MLVDRINSKFDKEIKLYAEKDSGSPMARLIEILGKELLEKIKNDIPELYDSLMEYIKGEKELQEVFHSQHQKLFLLAKVELLLQMMMS